MLAYEPNLAARSRFVASPRADEGAQAWELAVLTGCGVAAALAVIFIDFGVRVPGHAILRSILPMSLGLAIVPRRGAGIVMSASALITALVVGSLGHSAGMGSTTSLLCTGPLLDLASRQSGHACGWRLFALFGMAGLLSNAIAFVVRAIARPNNPGWWSMAPVSYAACGLLAGAIAAAICFRSRERTEDSLEHSAP